MYPLGSFNICEKFHGNPSFQSQPKVHASIEPAGHPGHRVFLAGTLALTLTCLLRINISAVKLGMYKLDLLPNSRAAVNSAQLDNVSL